MLVPILYTYRRCPYAMRARLAIQQAGIAVEMREISLRDKPQAMLAISSKGTVPVLQLDNHQVIDQSLDIMCWALQQQDQDDWLNDLENSLALIMINDSQFKTSLDAYKYPERYPQKTQIAHRATGEEFLAELESRLSKYSYLNANKISLADMAIFPFVRQFAAVDSKWFELAPYPKLRAWLDNLVTSTLFLTIMQK